jgi:hypothetical protein
MTVINDIEVDDLLDLLASSDGDLQLAAERLNTKLNLEYGTIKETDLKERVSAFDVQSSDRLSAKFRALLTIKLFNLVILVTNQLQFELGELKPAELAKTHASLVNSFTSLTAPATKITFDYDRELAVLAEDFKLPIEDLRGQLKEMEVKVKSARQ